MKTWLHLLSTALRIVVLLIIVVVPFIMRPRPAFADDPEYYLPWLSNVIYRVNQGWYDEDSHDHVWDQHAYDFSLPEGSPVRASRAGVIKWVQEYMETCEDDPNITGNGVVIYHDDGTATLYMHMKQNSVFVEEGNRVAQGAVLGLSGHTGYVNPCDIPNGIYGDHLHFSRQSQLPAGQEDNLPWTVTQEVYFAEYPPEYPGDQLDQNVNYKSRNYTVAVLFAHAPVPDAGNEVDAYHKASPLLGLAPQNVVGTQNNMYDLQTYPISGDPPLSTQNGWNDDASSIHVPEGVRVTLYSAWHYTGYPQYVDEDFSNKDHWLPDNPVGNDAVSSVRYDGAWLYEEVNYNNGSDVLKPTFRTPHGPIQE